ncbi:hypothetical protein NPIL_467901 [Nephila pilipes]|uniref:Uncharacterized protein n=1 Tax=Nephila pilipes TaxID=299642 RepID=A0A8X6MVR2_NEPPI|nr:hypothetical protein NPIL_467901 [Nephila pilipes]
MFAQRAMVLRCGVVRASVFATAKGTRTARYKRYKFFRCAKCSLRYGFGRVRFAKAGEAALDIFNDQPTSFSFLICIYPDIVLYPTTKIWDQEQYNLSS